MAKNQRKIANYFKSASWARGYHVTILLSGIVLMSVLLLLAAQQMSEVNLAVGSLPNSELSFILVDKLNFMARVFFASFVIYALGAVIVLFVIAHRIGGPKVKILRFIDQLKAGNFNPPPPLRKGDELGDIMDKLEELAASLKKREGAE